MSGEYVLIYVDSLGFEHVLATSEDRRDIDNLKIDIERLSFLRQITLKVEFAPLAELA